MVIYTIWEDCIIRALKRSMQQRITKANIFYMLIPCVKDMRDSKNRITL
jgi:hypothetical protein